MEQYEEIPDSLSTLSCTPPETSCVLGNLAEIFSNDKVSTELQMNVLETESVPDSEETHISSEHDDPISPVIPHQPDFRLSKPPNNSERLSNNLPTYPLDSAKPFIAEIDRLEEDKDEIIDQPQRTEFLKTAEDSPSMAEAPSMNSPTIAHVLHQVEINITTLSEQISADNCKLTDSQIVGKENNIKELINNVAVNNKKEKEELIKLKKNGAKVKDRLRALAECQRMLVSMVQQQTVLTQKIKEYRQKQQAEEDLSHAEHSQSLLENTVDLTTKNNQFQSPVRKLPSILKKKTEIAGNFRSIRKKVVQFKITYKNNESMLAGSSDQACVDEAEQNGPAISGKVANAEMVCQDSQALSSLSEMETEPVGACEAMEVVESLPSENIIESAIPTLSALCGGDTCEKDCSQTPVIKDWQDAVSTQDHAKTNFDEQSNDSSSLISGISGFEIRPLPQPFQLCSQPSRLINTLSSQPMPSNTSFGVTRPAATLMPIAEPGAMRKTKNSSNSMALYSDQLLAMSELIRLQLLKPGQDVIRCIAQGRSHKASLLKNGFIQGAERMVFQSPMLWMKALTGLKQVARMRAYKSVFYEGRTLYEICHAAASKSAPAVSGASCPLKKQFPRKKKISFLPFSSSPLIEPQESFSQPLPGQQRIETMFLRQYSQPHIPPPHQEFKPSPPTTLRRQEDDPCNLLNSGTNRPFSQSMIAHSRNFAATVLSDLGSDQPFHHNTATHEHGPTAAAVPDSGPYRPFSQSLTVPDRGLTVGALPDSGLDRPFSQSTAAHGCSLAPTALPDSSLDQSCSKSMTVHGCSLTAIAPPDSGLDQLCSQSIAAHERNLTVSDLPDLGPYQPFSQSMTAHKRSRTATTLPDSGSGRPFRRSIAVHEYGPTATVPLDSGPDQPCSQNIPAHEHNLGASALPHVGSCLPFGQSTTADECSHALLNSGADQPFSQSMIAPKHCETESQHEPTTNSKPASQPAKRETVLLVQDDELFEIQDVFPGFDWRSGRVPKNISEFLL